MRVLLIDDHSLFRRGLRLMLRELMPDADVSDVADVASALALCDERFDLILLDLHMPGIEGLEALEAVREAFKYSTVVVISGDDDADLIRSTIQRGASGFIPKAAEPDIMYGALRLIMANGIYLPPQAMNAAPAPQAAALHGLSPRQMEVLKHALKGTPNKLIARDMAISEGTVKSHLSAAFQTLNVRNRTEALYCAAKMGLRL